MALIAAAYHHHLWGQACAGNDADTPGMAECVSKEAIRAARQKSAQECSASSGAMQMKAQDKQSLACKEAFRQRTVWRTVKPPQQAGLDAYLL